MHLNHLKGICEVKIESAKIESVNHAAVIKSGNSSSAKRRMEVFPAEVESPDLVPEVGAEYDGPRKSVIVRIVPRRVLLRQFGLPLCPGPIFRMW